MLTWFLRNHAKKPNRYIGAQSLELSASQYIPVEKWHGFAIPGGVLFRALVQIGMLRL